MYEGYGGRDGKFRVRRTGFQVIYQCFGNHILESTDPGAPPPRPTFSFTFLKLSITFLYLILRETNFFDYFFPGRIFFIRRAQIWRRLNSKKKAGKILSTRAKGRFFIFTIVDVDSIRSNNIILFESGETRIRQTRTSIFLFHVRIRGGRRGNRRKKENVEEFLQQF